MEPKPLLFPFLYDMQEAVELLSESTSIYEAPVLRERLQNVDEINALTQEGLVKKKETNSQAEKPPAKSTGKVRSIALKNRKLIRGVVLRNEFAKLLVETKDGPLWIAKSQIVQIYE